MKTFDMLLRGSIIAFLFGVVIGLTVELISEVGGGAAKIYQDAQEEDPLRDAAWDLSNQAHGGLKGLFDDRQIQTRDVVVHPDTKTICGDISIQSDEGYMKPYKKFVVVFLETEPLIAIEHNWVIGDPEGRTFEQLWIQTCPLREYRLALRANGWYWMWGR